MSIVEAVNFVTYWQVLLIVSVIYFELGVWRLITILFPPAQGFFNLAWLWKASLFLVIHFAIDNLGGYSFVRPYKCMWGFLFCGLGFLDALVFSQFFFLNEKEVQISRKTLGTHKRWTVCAHPFLVLVVTLTKNHLSFILWLPSKFEVGWAFRVKTWCCWLSKRIFSSCGWPLLS